VLAISDDGVPADPGDPATFPDDSVKLFDARTGERLAGAGVPPNSGLVGPAAVLFPDGPRRGLLVVNQNQFQPLSGEVRHYDADGLHLADHVPATAHNAPWAPTRATSPRAAGCSPTPCAAATSSTAAIRSCWTRTCATPMERSRITIRARWCSGRTAVCTSPISTS
jgi:hypothetical protein